MSTELKVTPGDWKVGGSADIVLIEVNEQPLIECVFTDEDYRDLLDDDEREITREEAEANAHLISAAKDMYDLLEKILQKSDTYAIDLDDVLCDLYLEKRITDVLKKARGETA